MRGVLGITKNIFLENGRIVEVVFKDNVALSATKLLKRVAEHKCLAVRYEDYENILVFTKYLNVKKIDGITHLAKHITDTNLYGLPQPRYLVVRPIYKIKEGLVRLQEHDFSKTYWARYKEQLYDVIQNEINDSELLIGLIGVGRRLIEN